MIKLALALGFMAVFGIVTCAIVMKLISNNNSNLKRKNGKH